jgi:Fur family transcriptional regulator, ferric uptake regulator
MLRLDGESGCEPHHIGSANRLHYTSGGLSQCRRGAYHEIDPMTVAPRREPFPFRDIDDVAAAVRRDGGRLTLPRRQVLEALFAAEGLVSAEQIAAGADTGIEIELTSVYRNLERLEELGVTRHVHIGHGPGLYGLVGDGEREYLVCDVCRVVSVVDPARLDRVRATIRDEFGIEPRFAHFPIHGLCDQCAADERG